MLGKERACEGNCTRNGPKEMCRGGGICQPRQVGCASWRDDKSAWRILEVGNSRVSVFRAIFCMRKCNICSECLSESHNFDVWKKVQTNPSDSSSVVCNSPLPTLPYSGKK